MASLESTFQKEIETSIDAELNDSDEPSFEEVQMTELEKIVDEQASGNLEQPMQPQIKKTAIIYRTKGNQTTIEPQKIK